MGNGTASEGVETSPPSRHYGISIFSPRRAVEYKDYYQIMGVGREASADDIKRAYRRLARKYHPDVSKEKDAEARFKEVGEAYEVLRDPEKRAAYDALGTRKPGEEFRPPPDWQFGDGTETDAGVHSDFFEQLFGGLGRGRRGSFRSRGFDTAGEVEVTVPFTAQPFAPPAGRATEPPPFDNDNCCPLRLSV